MSLDSDVSARFDAIEERLRSFEATQELVIASLKQLNEQVGLLLQRHMKEGW